MSESIYSMEIYELADINEADDKYSKKEPKEKERGRERD